MKRILLFISILVGLFAGQASAAMYQMDATTAAGMLQLSVSTGDTSTLEYVGYNPGGLADKVFGTGFVYGGTIPMTYAVGFAGPTSYNPAILDDSAIATIGLYSSGASVGLSGTWDDFLLPVANDNDDVWRYQSYVTVGTATYSSAWVTLLPGATAGLIALTPSMDFSTVTGIGFSIEWKPSLNSGSTGDTYHTSVVPVPAAVLLGLLGLGVAGWKLRKFA